MKKKAIIYGVRSGNTYHYIGKTVKINHEGEVPNSNVGRQYMHADLRQVFINNDIVVDNLFSCDESEWYDEKLLEVVQKHAEDHPLLNAQWMLDGKRGYWEGTNGVWFGKKRDANTLKQLSISKYKKVCQYSVEGILLQIWDGGKEAAIKVFGDYKVVNNSGKTKLYKALDSKTMKGRFRMNCYWFRYEDLIKYFGVVPKKLNITAMLAKEIERRKARRAKQSHNRTHAVRYTVLQYNKDGKVINRFDNTSHAAFELKISLSVVQKFCSGKRLNSNYILAFGEKVLQKLNLNYGNYKCNYKSQPKVLKPKVKTRTRYKVNQYVGGVVVQSFDSVCDCVTSLGFKESTIRRLCRNEMKLSHDYPVLKFGEKVKMII